MIRKTLALVLCGMLCWFATACGDSTTDRMAKEHENDEPVANGSSAKKPSSPVKDKTVTYATVDGTEVSGYMARPENADTGALPGLIVIHEWWGLNDNIRHMTRRLAAEGYRALAVDLYRGKAAEAPENARSLMEKANSRKQENIENLKQAYKFLTEQQNAKNVGVIGWCFGGGRSLQTALAMPEQIDATVIYYGHLVTDVKPLKTLQMPILGHFGEEDSAIPPEKVNEFSSALENAGKDATIHIYEGAGHAFANPSGKRYDPDAAEKSWKRTVAFLKKHLR